MFDLEQLFLRASSRLVLPLCQSPGPLSGFLQSPMTLLSSSSPTPWGCPDHPTHLSEYDFQHFFTNCLLAASCVPGTFGDPGNMAVSKTDKRPASRRLSLVRWCKAAQKANQIRPCRTVRTRKWERMVGEGSLGWAGQLGCFREAVREGLSERRQYNWGLNPKSDPATQTTTGGMFQTDGRSGKSMR